MTNDKINKLLLQRPTPTPTPFLLTSKLKSPKSLDQKVKNAYQLQLAIKNSPSLDQQAKITQVFRKES